MRVVVMGSSAFAVPALRAVAEAGHTIPAVYTRPPKPAGRGQSARPTVVQTEADTLGLPVRTPASLKPADAVEAFAALEADVALVAAYGLLLRPEVLEAPRHGCLNLHASLLPRWRGAAPIQRAIEAGDQVTGVGLMRMEAGLDTGPVALEVRTRIGETETAGELHDRLADLGAGLAVRGLQDLGEGHLSFTHQSGEPVYAPKVEKSETRIDWHRAAWRLGRMINAFSPFPGAWCEMEDARIKVLRARARPDEGEADKAPGTILDADERLLVQAQDGAVELLELQRAGGKPTDAAAFLRGFGVERGVTLT